MNGRDGRGNEFGSIDELWNKDSWYQKSSNFWETTELSVNGVLGGFGHISGVDVSSSRAILKSLPDMKFRRSIDCGSGIGRLVSELLLPLFSRVDMVEQSPTHVVEAKRRLASHKNMGEFYTEGLQTFVPSPGSYDCVWIQWVLGYLTDPDLVAFLQRCAAALTPNGYICIKENVCKKGFVLDNEDNCVTRSTALFKELFGSAGLELFRAKKENSFPSELYPVYTFVLRKP